MPEEVKGGGEGDGDRQRVRFGSRGGGRLPRTRKAGEANWCDRERQAGGGTTYVPGESEAREGNAGGAFCPVAPGFL
jgi:hypothetical protein